MICNLCTIIRLNLLNRIQLLFGFNSIFNFFFFSFLFFPTRLTSSNCLHTLCLCVYVCTKCALYNSSNVSANIVILLQLSCFFPNVLGSLCCRRRNRWNRDKSNENVQKKLVDEMSKYRVYFQPASKFNLVHSITFVYSTIKKCAQKEIKLYQCNEAIFIIWLIQNFFSLLISQCMAKVQFALEWFLFLSLSFRCRESRSKNWLYQRNLIHEKCFWKNPKINFFQFFSQLEKQH